MLLHLSSAIKQIVERSVAAINLNSTVEEEVNDVSAEMQFTEDRGILGSIPAKLIFIHEIGIYQVLVEAGFNQVKIAQIIGYITQSNPQAVYSLLGKIRYKEIVPTEDDPHMKGAKKNNPYTDDAIKSAVSKLILLDIEVSPALYNKYRDVIN
jgi:hypothetical protein